MINLRSFLLNLPNETETPSNFSKWSACTTNYFHHHETCEFNQKDSCISNATTMRYIPTIQVSQAYPQSSNNCMVKPISGMNVSLWKTSTKSEKKLGTLRNDTNPQAPALRARQTKEQSQARKVTTSITLDNSSKISISHLCNRFWPTKERQRQSTRRDRKKSVPESQNPHNPRNKKEINYARSAPGLSTHETTSRSTRSRS